MKIENLNQLKKVFVEGARFEIILHIRKKCIGEVRLVTKANTAGVYSIIPGTVIDPYRRDGGLGNFFEWGPARFWTFDSEGVCAKYSNYIDKPNEILIAFKII